MKTTEKLKAKLTVGNGGSAHIEVKMEFGEVNIWDGIVSHCCRKLSNNQIKSVYHQISEQVNGINKEDIPPVFSMILHDFYDEIERREILV